MSSVEFQRQLPWSRPGDSREGGVAGVRRLRVKGHAPHSRRRRRGRAEPLQDRGGPDEEAGPRPPRRLNLSVVRTDSCWRAPERQVIKPADGCLFLWLTGASVQSKFEEIRKSNQAAAQRLVESQISSSSSDDDDNDDDGAVDHEDGKRGKILASTFTTYTNQTGEPGVQSG